MQREYVVVCLLCRVVVILQIITNASFVLIVEYRFYWNIFRRGCFFFLFFSTQYNIVGSFFDKTVGVYLNLNTLIAACNTFRALVAIYEKRRKKKQVFRSCIALS